MFKRVIKKIVKVSVFFFLGVIVHTSFVYSDTSKVLYVFTWSEYIPYRVLKQFTQETGIKVIISTFESNESMYAKLRLLNGKGYDIVIPTGYFIGKLRKDNLLARIDKSKIIGLENIAPRAFRQAYDPHNEYSIPYMLGSIGMLVNKKSIDPKSMVSFNDLLRPEFHGRVLLSDDMRDTFGVALKACGYSVNTRDPLEIKAAYEWLKKLKPSVRVFDVTATKQVFISEEVLAGISWNGDAFIAIQENSNLEFVIPKEGLVTWTDNLSILAKAENVENAYIFINFLLRPDIAKKCVEEFHYTTPNIAARKLLEPHYRDNKVIFPYDKDVKKGESINGVGSAFEIYSSYWEELKSGKE